MKLVNMLRLDRCGGGGGGGGGDMATKDAKRNFEGRRGLKTCLLASCQQQSPD